MDNKKRKLIKTAEETLDETIKNSISGTNMTSEDVSSITKLCTMSAFPEGNEDLKTIVRKLSNKFIDDMMSKFQSMISDPILAPISQFILIEWCYRHDYLNDDWRWEWNSKNEGVLNFSSKISLDQARKNAGKVC